MFSKPVDFNSKEFVTLCKQHKIKELYAFGSLVNGGFTETSDIDLIVELEECNPVMKGKLLLSLYNKLQSLFKKNVDILTFDSVRNPILEEQIESTKKLVYFNGSKA